MAEIKDDEHAVIKKLAKNQHAWAFPDFVSRGGAMQFEEIFQCWKVIMNLFWVKITVIKVYKCANVPRMS